MLSIKMRAGVLCLAALFILSGTMTSIAAASPFFHVNNTKLAEGVKKQLKLQAKAKSVLRSEKLGIELECAHSGSEGATLENVASQGQGKGRVTYSQCHVILPKTECKVAEPIQTKQIKSYLASETGAGSKNFTEIFEPTEGTVFVEIKFSNCNLLNGSQPVKGNAAAEIVRKEVEATEGLVVFPEPAITEVLHNGVKVPVTLEIAGDAATFTSVYSAQLTNPAQEPFGVFLN